ncbi:MAG: murein biosynthesis integral membrane protein MurJ, partial [Alphaproteobacteria bacterium]|nr:murein biosynthesis integral membrane protein MurJ [Alphaproteobacteria bacterium]
VGIGVSAAFIIIAVALILSLWLGARMGFNHRLASLIGVGTAICGASAIAALTPAIGAKEEESGLAVSGVVQAFWLAISCYRAGVTIPLARPRLSEVSRRLFKQIGPGALGAGAAQVNLLLSTILASTLPTGAVSYLYYADRLNQLPLGIVGIAVATTLLPLLARQEAAGNADAVRHYTSRAIEFCLLLGLPATVGLALAAEPIIQTLFEHGAFGHADTVETSRALAAYALGVPAFLLVKVFSARFFARHDTRTPVRTAIVSMVTNVVGALLLLGLLEHVGIALAASFATWTNATQLYLHLRRNGETICDDKLKRRLPRLLLCAVGMGLVTFMATQGLADYFDKTTIWKEATALTFIIGISGLSYVFLLQITGAMPIKEALRIFKGKA